MIIIVNTECVEYPYPSSRRKRFPCHHRYSRDELENAIQQVESLANTDRDMHFKELRQQEKRLGFLPALVKALPL